MKAQKFSLYLVAGIVCLTTVAYTVCGFGPKKLYSLTFDRDIASVTVINRQMIFSGHYQISVIDNVQWKFRQRGRMIPRVINKDIADPRLVGKIPARTFKGDNAQSYWVSSWGTNQTSGAIHVMKQTSTYSVIGDITVDSGWNYEMAQWVDMNRDGRRDCLTARFRGGVGQMLWFEQPAGQSIWGQRIIHEGLADGNFVGFLYDKKTYIIVAGNQFNTLGLYWSMDRKNNWKHSRQVRHRVIDNYGKYFDVQYIDLNKDGRPDVLTTTVQISSSRGQVLGYEIPYDIQNKDWKRHVLAIGFVGDYSPGKAAAYWPNKWKRKSDRPSIFLTGGSEATLYILSPTPKNKGWGYYKSELAAGAGTPGIPFIMDMNGDSFPEFFVPQGSQVHVFSYDYSSSVAGPPKRGTSSAGKVTVSKPALKFRPPFFRPTAPPPIPAIPADAPPVGPIIPSGGSSLENSSPNRLPSQPRAPASNPISQGGGANFFQTTRPASAPQAPPAAPSSNVGSSANVPLAPNPLAPNPLAPNRLAPQPYYPVDQPSSSNQLVVLGNDGWLYTRTGYSNQFLQRSQQPAANNTLIPIPSPGDNMAVPNDAFANNNPITDNQANQPEANLPYDVTPPNLVLWVTEDSFGYRSEAADVCEVNNRVLCSLQQLQDAVRFGGTVPNFDWGWYATENRAASLKSCLPGEVKWDGYVCYNGDVEHTAVVQETTLPALCCAVINGANVTSQKFMRKSDAAKKCTTVGSHLCSLDEMLNVWQQSTYKDIVKGWFDSDDHLIKMTHYCDVNSAPWPGYMCVAGKLEVTEVQTAVQEQAFCCQNAAASLGVSILSLLLAFCAAMINAT